MALPVMTAATDLRVLLFSPIEGRDSLSGDTEYTKALLQHPPRGVTYTTYEAALDQGLISLRGRRPRALRECSPAEFGILGLRTLELLVRRSGQAFREPTWFVKIKTNAFDLVHQHLFAVQQCGPRLPVVSTAGFPLSELYRHREEWSPAHIQRALLLESLWVRMLHVHSPWLHAVTPSIMLTYSEAARAFLLDRGVPSEQTAILGTGLPETEPRHIQKTSGQALLFVGRDFRRKGGDVVVEAHRRLRENSGATLTVVTSRPAVPTSYLDSDIRWIFEAKSEDLQTEVYPTHDILLAPTTCDCGVPYAVLEAMRAGLAILITPSRWLDPRLTAPDVILAEGTPVAVADALQFILSDQTALRESKDRAYRLWKSSFTTSALGVRLRVAYDSAIGQCLPDGLPSMSPRQL